MSLFAGIGSRPYLRWPSKVTLPWQSLSRTVYPRTIEEVFAWAEELWMHHGLYTQAIKRAVRYFMTEVEILGEGLDAGTRRKYAETITDNFDLMEEAATIGDDFISFGNSFTSLYAPFQRQLRCNKCQFLAPLLRYVEAGIDALQWTNYEFTGTCPHCHQPAQYERVDQLFPAEKLKPKIVRWPPQYIQIKRHPISGNKAYILDVYRYVEMSDGVRRGDPQFLAETPWEFIEALKNNRPLEFTEERIYHMSNPVPAVQQPSLRGWGLPLFMSEFETAVLIMLLDKYTETIATDYLVPFRIIFPTARAGQEDPLVSVDMGGFMGYVRKMIDEHRVNPSTFHTLPFPVEQAMIGGDATKLIPVELLQFYEKRLLHSMGIPEEFQTSQLETNAPIIGFTLFERQWQFFANQLNKWLSWLANQQGALLSWESVRARLIPVSIYEDPEIRQIKMQLAAAGKISDTTALRTLNINWKEERRLILEEQEEQQNEQEEQQKKMQDQEANAQGVQTPSPGAVVMQQQQAAQGAAGAPAAQPPPGMGGAPAPALAPTGEQQVSTLDDLMNKADALAQQIIGMPPQNRRQELTNLKKQDPALHAQVTARIKDMEQQGASQGVQMARQGAAAG